MPRPGSCSVRSGGNSQKRSVISNKSIAEEIINCEPIPGFAENNRSKPSNRSTSSGFSRTNKPLNNKNYQSSKKSTVINGDSTELQSTRVDLGGANFNSQTGVPSFDISMSRSPRTTAVSNTAPRSVKDLGAATCYSDQPNSAEVPFRLDCSLRPKANSHFAPEKDMFLESESAQDGMSYPYGLGLIVKEDQVNTAVELLLEGADPMRGFDVEILREAVKELNRLKIEKHTRREYLEAEHIARIQKSAQKAVDNTDFLNSCAVRMVDLFSKVEDAQNVVDTLNLEWDDEFRKLEEIIEAKTKELHTQHLAELNVFDSNIPTVLPAKYMKHSTQYFRIRHLEESLARNGEYVEANKYKIQADKLEEVENTKQFMKLQDDLQNSRNALVDKQNKQFALFTQWVNKKRHMMLLARQKAMEGPERRLRHYINLVADREQNGVAPNPNLGFSTNRVSKKDSFKVVREAVDKKQAQLLGRSYSSLNRGMSPFGVRATASVAEKGLELAMSSSRSRGYHNIGK